MVAIANIGTVLEVTPQDEIWIKISADTCERARDFSSFRMRVEGVLEEHGTLIGVFGPVVGGAPRYQNLVASLLVRLDSSDWSRDLSTQANFQVGPGRVHRIAEYDFRDPRGTEIDGFPVIGRFGHVKVLNAEPAGCSEPRDSASVSSRASVARGH
jgi:hypothetical protein